MPRNLSQVIIKEDIPVRHHNVIYKLIDDLKTEITKKLPMTTVEEEIGAYITKNNSLMYL